jgi:hypothetical protein
MIGWDGWTGIAGDVKTTPCTRSSTQGSSAAFVCSCKEEKELRLEHHLCSQTHYDDNKSNTQMRFCFTFKTIAPPVECPNKKHGKP